MPIRWERLAGDTGVFALKMAFAHDPDEGRGVDPEVALSWGSFQIWINGRNLCTHQEEGEQIDSVHWYLLPLMEWFVRNWNPLLHEERLPVRNDGDTGWKSLRATRFPPPAIENDEETASEWESEWQTWWARHALRSAREGGLFPDVILRRLRDSVEVSWGPVRGEGMPQHFDFSESVPGVSRLDPDKVAEPLHDVLSGANEYLLSLAPESHGRIHELSESLRDLESADRSDQRLMWLAGLGMDEQTVRTGWQRAKISLSSLAEVHRRALLETSEASPLVVSGSCHAALMFGSLAPEVGEQDVLSLARTMVDLYSPEGDPETIRAICRSAAIEETGSPSWSQGYELADELHEHFCMQFAQGESVDIEGLIEALGVTVMELKLSDKNIRGVSAAGPQHRPGIVVNTCHDANAHAWGRRFTLAHELCHLLFDREVGRRLAIASGPWAPRDIERRANAFAAMLLMPTSVVQRAVSKVSVTLSTREGVLEVTRELCVGVRSVLSHLKNLGFISEVDQQLIDNEILLLSES